MNVRLHCIRHEYVIPLTTTIYNDKKKHSKRDREKKMPFVSRIPHVEDRHFVPQMPLSRASVFAFPLQMCGCGSLIFAPQLTRAHTHTTYTISGSGKRTAWNWREKYTLSEEKTTMTTKHTQKRHFQLQFHAKWYMTMAERYENSNAGIV